MEIRAIYKITCVFVTNILLFVGYLAGWEFEFDNQLYILSGIGGIALFIILAGLGKQYHALEDQKPLRWIGIGLAAAETIGLHVMAIIHWDFYMVLATIILASWFWAAFCTVSDPLWTKFQFLVQNATRSAAILILLFTFAYFGYVPIRLVGIGAMPAWDMVFDLAFALTVGAVGVAMWYSNRYRYGFVFTVIATVIWIMFPGDWMLENREYTSIAFETAYLMVAGIALGLGAVAGLGLGAWWGEAIRLRRSHKSMLLGPWFSSILGIFQKISLTEEQRHAVKHGSVSFAIFLALILPGVLAQAEVWRPAVTIEPGDKQVTFNFWAYPNPDNYTAAEIAAFNKHKVNLDIMSHITLASIGDLIKFETLMPDITYRLTISQPNITKMPDRVKELTEIMLAYEANDTLNQWKGFAFDIEGEAYNWFVALDDSLPVIDIWNQVFDYLDAKSLERGKTIETECVHSYQYAVDEMFDNDLDLQILEGQISYTPKRFTIYAPMIYRCWPSGDLPYGSPKEPFDDAYRWGTSYMIYTRLTTVSAYIQPPHLGVYLGITNTSCYGRDMPQEEPISWGEPTGVDNLIRDILVAKSFGITEVTFFLQFTHTEPNGEVFGGLLDSYGDDILDRIHDAVNVHPPESFQIYYDNSDAWLAEDMNRDYFCDFNRLSWEYLVIVFWGVLTVLAMKPKFSQRKQTEGGSIQLCYTS